MPALRQSHLARGFKKPADACRLFIVKSGAQLPYKKGAATPVMAAPCN
jgi:hypothetical protein